MKLKFTPIGLIHSPHRQAEGTPIQPRWAAVSTATPSGRKTISRKTGLTASPLCLRNEFFDHGITHRSAVAQQ
ncbi:MAG: hypothetical protein WBW41_13635 [Verrucomicrobiia bacterium]